MATVTLLYFASLREAAGRSGERVDTDAQDLQQLYAEAQVRHGFQWPLSALRVAVDGEFATWRDAVSDGAEVAFIPPVSGG